MKQTSCVRFFHTNTLLEMQNAIDLYMQRNPNWEITSTSHLFIDGKVSVALGLKLIKTSTTEIDLPTIETT